MQHLKGFRATPGSIVFHFVDVGQGDATLIVDTDTRRALIIDCASKGVPHVARLLADHGAIVDTMILTHWDLDHYGGMTRLFSQFGTGRFLYNHDSLIAQRDEDRSKILATLRQILRTTSAEMELGPATVGVAGSLGTMHWRLLAPIHRHLTQAVVTGERNLSSGVVSLEAHGQRVIVGGDADARVWHAVEGRGESLKGEVLRYPHHGSLGPRQGPKPMEPTDLLNLVDPSHTVFSVGTNNPHGHPLPEAIEATSASGSRVLCTQVTRHCHNGELGEGAPCAGNVTLQIDANGLVIRPSVTSHDDVIDGWSRPMCR